MPSELPTSPAASTDPGKRIAMAATFCLSGRRREKTQSIAVLTQTNWKSRMMANEAVTVCKAV